MAFFLVNIQEKYVIQENILLLGITNLYFSVEKQHDQESKWHQTEYLPFLYLLIEKKKEMQWL